LTLVASFVKFKDDSQMTQQAEGTNHGWSARWLQQGRRPLTDHLFNG